MSAHLLTEKKNCKNENTFQLSIKPNSASPSTKLYIAPMELDASLSTLLESQMRKSQRLSIEVILKC